MVSFNDYELLYLINWHSEEAEDLLIKKYIPLVNSVLRRFKIQPYHYKDYEQEGLMVIVLSIKIYDEKQNKTFCRFLELLLERRVMKLLSKDTKVDNYLLLEEYDSFQDYRKDYYSQLKDEYLLKSISSLEVSGIRKQLMREVLIKEEAISEFAKKNNLSIKDVYNNIYLIRSLLKKNGIHNKE